MEDWQLEDPAGKDIQMFREVRDDIRKRVRALLRANGIGLGKAKGGYGAAPDSRGGSDIEGDERP